MAERLMSAIEEIHLIELEQLMDDDLKCQSNHDTPQNAKCSVTVTHRAWNCRRPDPFLVCEEYAVTTKRDLEKYIRCALCKRNVYDCWQILPC